MAKKTRNKLKSKIMTSSRYGLVVGVFLFALIGGGAYSLLTNSNASIGNSSASIQEPADINNDNVVDIVDLSILLSNWNTTNNLSDINNDNVVDIVDLSILLSKWGSVLATEKYGPAFNMDSLGNMQVGGSSSGASNTYVSYRFRAEQQSPLSAFRAYWLGPSYPGYGGGSGGTIRCTIETDDGSGAPSGSVLATYDHKPVLGGEIFPLLTLSTPTSTLSAGQLYHIVFTNVDPNPTVNFASVDLTFLRGDVLRPRQPKYSDDDYAALRKYPDTSWEVQGRYTPILDISYANGARQGQGYMEVEAPNEIVVSGTTHMARERFTVSGGDRTISSAAVRLAKLSGTGDVVVSLEDSSGVLINSSIISTDSLPIGSPENGMGSWVSGSFSEKIILKNGLTYYLRISTDSSTSLWQRGIQQGNSYGFDSSTYFDDGYLQVTTNGGSTWNTVSGLGTAGDLQFYLE